MSRTAICSLTVLLAISAGCGKNDSDRHEVAAESLPVLQPKSGGEMLLLPAGTFVMGDSATQPDDVEHEVAVGSFYLDKYTVTQELYEKVTGVNPSKRKDPKNPVNAARSGPDAALLQPVFRSWTA